MMAFWQGGVVEVNGLRLHYTRSGAGTLGTKPSVVLMHGVTDDGLCWTPVAEALAPEYDVIMVDARGHGRSDAPKQGYGPAAQAEDLAGVIRGLGLQRPAVLGHSMGAITALTLAGTYPDLPRAILLEDPPAWWMPLPEGSASGDEREAQMRAWLTGLKRKPRDELIAEQRAATPHWSDAELGPWAEAKLRVSPNVLSIFAPTIPASVDWPKVLRRIMCPALLITADPMHGAIVTAESATALQALAPQLRIAHIPEAGHSIRRDQFDRYLDVVRAFLYETAKGS
jgi:pimeloyl-ACP methyl ester carboxylesterase